MVSEEIHHFEESKRLAITVPQTRCMDWVEKHQGQDHHIERYQANGA